MLKDSTYEEFLKENDKLEKLLPRFIWDYVDGCNRVTGGALSAMWKKNLAKNVKKLLRKHARVDRDFLGFGKDRAIIAIGAGPSFNINKDVLKAVYQQNLLYSLEDQPFILIASNHQFKPLLKMGIVPHFVMLIDGGDAVYDQLCTDIPEDGQKTILLAALQCSHKVLRDWDRQGRMISFYMHANQACQDLFKEITGNDANSLSIPSGGNVMNGAWLLSMRVMHSTVFMALGNDLSYPYSRDYDSRKNAFYADGDYSVNIANKRDEARERFAWQGFSFVDGIIKTQRPYINLQTVCTSRQLFIYKLWAEMHAVAWSDNEQPFQYYNCSEAGVLGVVPKSYEPQAMKDKKNWQLLDHIIPKRWRTRRLSDAVSEYLQARQLCNTTNPATLIDAGSATVLAARTAIARSTDIVRI